MIWLRSSINQEYNAPNYFEKSKFHTSKYHLLINALRVAITFIHLLKNLKCGGVSIHIYFS